MDFRKIDFGRADAHTEGEDTPNLLKDGFVDIDQVVNRAVKTSTFLFLGYKGSGKSSLSEHLRLTQQDTVVDQQCLTDFPFKLFDKISEDKDKLMKYKTVWRWLLCVRVLSDLVASDSTVVKSNDELNKAISVFTQSGVFPVMSISSLVSKTTRTTASAVVQGLKLSHSVQREDEGVKDIGMLTDYIKNLICSIKEERPHIIVIDNLDDILNPHGIQFYNIAALINEVNSLNTFFSSAKVPVKILVLCRTDMFERLPDPNLNKIKQDKAFIFTWYREGIDNSKGSDLIKLINTRAKLVYPQIDDVLKTFFPSKYDDKNMYKAMLDFTRHTPRDFVQLMKYIQRHCESNKVTKEAITNGVKDYSTEYFKQEIENEMYGYLPAIAVRGILSVMSSLREQSFYYGRFLEECKKNIDLQSVKVDINDAMRVLYDCSAIGHVYSYKGEGITRVTFKYRNRTSTFTPDDKILLHKGLWKALNVNF